MSRSRDYSDPSSWNRRRFMLTLGTSALLAPAGLHASALPKPRHRLEGIPEGRGGPADEEYWAAVRREFALSDEYILLNHGGVSPTPRQVHAGLVNRLEILNQGPSFYVRRISERERDRLYRRLAALADCAEDEIVVNRNATEGLATVIMGLPLKAGDEVVLSHRDYPSAFSAWQQREKRDGIVLKWVNPPLFGTPEELVAAYTAQMTPRTRLVHLTHVTNWTGQVFPARLIADAVHARGAEVLLDAAHSFAILPFSFAETGADYAAASLHKWLCAPYGTGVLMVRKSLIGKVWPMFPGPADEDPASIRKFEHLGTHAFAADLAVHDALDFHEQIGEERKRQRLMYLKHYWASRIAEIPGAKLLSPAGAEEGSGIATFCLQGKSSDELHGKLLNTYKIHTSPVRLADFHGVRITPHVFTTPVRAGCPGGCRPNGGREVNEKGCL